MVRKPYYPNEQPPNMQYPPPGSSQPGQGQGNWQAPPSNAGQYPGYPPYQGSNQYQGYPPPQGSSLYPASSPPAQQGPYGAPSFGESSSYYGNSQQPSSYSQPQPGNQYNNSYPPPQQYNGPPSQQPMYSPPPQNQYGYGPPPGTSPYGSPPPVPATRPAGYGAPGIKQEDFSGPGQPAAAPQTEEERGLMGALAGGAAGAYGGHKVNHGFIGALGGAYAGHKLEDAYKDHKRHSQSPQPPPSVPQDSRPQDQNHGMAGNFSASSTDMTLDGDYDLIASCSDVGGHRKMSSISLNGVLTNEDGHFKWAASGNFGGSARNVRLVEGGRVLEAELARCDGGWNWDRVRLDERIENADGDLRMV